MSRTSFMAPWQARWQALAPREQTLIRSAALALAALGLWWVLLAPALNVLRQAEQRTPQLQAQLQHMQALQAQAQALQSQPSLGFDEAVRTLEQATTQILTTTARMNVVGEQAHITLKASSADALAQWLTQARLSAHATPVQAQLQREDNAQGAVWSGTLILRLPAH